jgi:hypothetical protein
MKARRRPNRARSNLNVALSMRSILLLLSWLIVLTLAGCASWQPAPSGDLLFSYRVKEGAFHGAPKHDIGTYFFWDKSSGAITGYRARAGKRTEIVAGGSVESQMLLRKISEIGFESFDYDEEARNLESSNRDKFFNAPRVLTLDGASFEIKFVFNGASFSMTRSNPRHEIDFYAPYSPKMAKLKALIDAFAQETGKAIFNTMN